MYSLSPIRMESVSAVTTSRGANDPQIGDRCQSGTEEYLYVYNAGNSQVPPTYAMTIAAAASTYSGTITSTTSQDLFIGVVKHTTITTGAYGWIVTRGFATVEMGASNSGAVSTLLTPGADGTFGVISAITDNFGNVCGKLLSAAASGASAGAYIFCM